LRRERNPKLVNHLKERRFDEHGILDCEVCAFNYSDSYGERGHKYMEAHHKRPLSSLRPEGEKVSPEDYALICANCHRMIHRYSPWWTIEELRGVWGESK
jgi:5-methylcytosine-specific restriction enzyme A